MCVDKEDLAPPALEDEDGVLFLRDGAVGGGVGHKAAVEAAGVGADEQLVKVVTIQAARHRLVPVVQLRKVRLRTSRFASISRSSTKTD